MPETGGGFTYIENVFNNKTRGRALLSHSEHLSISDAGRQPFDIRLLGIPGLRNSLQFTSQSVYIPFFPVLVR